MRKFYVLLAVLFGTLLLKAQTNTVGFTFTVDSITNTVVFANTSVLQSDGTRKAVWTFGDGSTTTTQPLSGTTHFYAAAGTYQACLKIYKYSTTNPADSLLLGSSCKTITLQQRCEAGFQWADSAFNNSPVHYVRFTGLANTNAGKRITQVCWKFGDGTDSCITVAAGAVPPLNLVHRYAQGGTYNACLRVVFDGGCVGERCLTLVLNTQPVIDSCTANFTSQTTLASTLGRRFVAQPWQSNGKKPVRICWNFGDGKDTCIQYPVSYTGDYWVEHQYATGGQYDVCATIKYDGGCEKKKCSTITVSQPAPSADSCRFELNEVASATANAERRFYVGLMAGRVAEKICWNFGDGTDTCVVLSNPLNAQQLLMAHRFAAPGTYNVCAKVTYAGGCTVQRCRTLSVTVAYSNLCGGYMTDSIVNANTIRFRGNGIQNPNDNVVSYNWTFGDGTSGSGQTVSHVYAAPGRYSVCLFLKAASGCETRVCNTVVIGGTSQPLLVLTPNPVASVLNAAFTSLLQQTVTVKIFNANGLMVRSFVRVANAGLNTWSFSDVGTLPTGVYSVIVQSPNQLATAIFFKQ